MASTWSITLRCGCTYKLLTGVPDLKTPYICGECGNTLSSVMMAMRNEERNDNGTDNTGTARGSRSQAR